MCMYTRTFIFVVLPSYATARERHGEEDEEREAPLGQLVWTPLPSGPAAPAGRGAARGEAADHAFLEDDGRAAAAASLSDAGDANSEEEDSENMGSDEGGLEEEEEAGRRERGRSRSRSNGDGVFGGAASDTRRRPWAKSPARATAAAAAAARSLSPGGTPYRTRRRAATDGAELGGEGVEVPAAALAERTRRQGVAGWLEGVVGGAANGAADGAPAVPSAESLVASILQASSSSWATSFVPYSFVCTTPALCGSHDACDQ